MTVKNRGETLDDMSWHTSCSCRARGEFTASHRGSQIMVRSSSPRLGALGISAAALALVLPLSVAEAQPPACNSLPSPIYGMGGSAQKPLIASIAIALANAEPPQTLTYNSTQGACSGIESLVDLPGTGRPYVPTTTTYWTAAGVEGTCTLPENTQHADFGLMGNTAILCQTIEANPLLLEHITSVQGPVGSVNVLVPADSSEYAITSEAFHFVFRYGPESGVEPWTGVDSATRGQSDFVRRNNSSFVKIFLSIAAGLPTAFTFVGADAGTNENTIVDLLARATIDPNRPIGFASGDVADDHRGVVRTLAFQHTGQTRAYWPDSNFDTFDKINVRTGQYFLWAPAHIYARLDGSDFESEAAERFLGYISGEIATPDGVDLLNIAIDNHSVPQCAMYVGRTADLSPLYSIQPEAPCHCYFEDRAVGSSSYDTCTGTEGTQGTCSGTNGANICRRGFCEVQ